LFFPVCSNQLCRYFFTTDKFSAAYIITFSKKYWAIQPAGSAEIKNKSSDGIL